MTNLARFHAANLPELMERIQRNSIGLDDYLNRFFNETTTQNYPPYNIVHVNNVESRLEIALAGFKKKEVKVYTEYGKLVVEGNKEQKDDADYAHQGLAQRSFQRSWGIADDTEVQKVDFEDGLLTITVGKIVPEHHARKDWL
jgi:HSP20 family molecular chaperone IbpA